MLFKDLVQTLEDMSKTSSKLEKSTIAAELLKKTDEDEIVILSRLIIGKLFPEWELRDLGVSEKTVLRVLSEMSNSERQVVKLYKELGDLGSVAERVLENRTQTTLFGTKELTIQMVYSEIMRIAQAAGKDSQTLKMQILKGLLLSCSALEAKYLIRAILSMMLTGFSEGLLEDAVVKAFGVEKKLVHNSYMYLPDYGEIARIAMTQGSEGLKKVKITPGKPVKPMLALSSPSAEDILKDFGRAAFEYKYDGVRLQVHNDSGHVMMFTRRLNDVTPQFPDFLEKINTIKNSKDYIIEGELLAVKDGKILPFQELSKRVRRIYDIERIALEVPVEFYAFDILYIDGEDVTGLAYEDRHKKLVALLEGSDVKIANRIVTDNVEEVKKFFKEAKEAGEEGLMAKDLNAPYSPGQRGKKMLKLKGILDTLDVVILQAEYGEGRKSVEGWLSRYIIGVKDPSKDGFLMVGRVASGLSDDELRYLTDELKKIKIREEGRVVTVEPKIVIEIAFEEIQKGDHYPSGFGIRFPRIVRIREDRSPEEIDDIGKIKRLYEQQFAKGTKSSGQGF